MDKIRIFEYELTEKYLKKTFGEVDLQLATFSKVLVELGVKTLGYNILSYFEGETHTFWKLNEVR
jgi:hypothetical protein